MDIQNIYLKQAHLYLNSSIIVLIPAILAIWYILGYSDEKLLVLVSPFLLYSLFLFQTFLLNYRRFLRTDRKMNEKAVERNEFINCHRFILHPNRDQKELFLFHPSGSLLGKIVQDQARQELRLGTKLYPKRYVLVDENDQTLATYFRNDGMVDVYQFENGYIGSFTSLKQRDKKGIFQDSSLKSAGTLCKEQTFLDDIIVNLDQKSVFRVREGIMPLESQEIFINPNSPILTISPILEEHNRFLYLSILIDRFFK